MLEKREFFKKQIVFVLIVSGTRDLIWLKVLSLDRS